MKIDKIIGITFIVLGIVIFVYLIYFFQNLPIEKDKIVKCYDRSGNEIIGMKCIEPGGKDLGIIGWLSLFLSPLFIVIGLGLLGRDQYD